MLGYEDFPIEISTDICDNDVNFENLLSVQSVTTSLLSVHQLIAKSHRVELKNGNVKS